MMTQIFRQKHQFNLGFTYSIPLLSFDSFFGLFQLVYHRLLTNVLNFLYLKSESDWHWYAWCDYQKKPSIKQSYNLNLHNLPDFKSYSHFQIIHVLVSCSYFSFQVILVFKIFFLKHLCFKLSISSFIPRGTPPSGRLPRFFWGQWHNDIRRGYWQW